MWEVTALGHRGWYRLPIADVVLLANEPEQSQLLGPLLLELTEQLGLLQLICEQNNISLELTEQLGLLQLICEQNNISDRESISSAMVQSEQGSVTSHMSHE
jgi:cell division inhibitor SulA